MFELSTIQEICIWILPVLFAVTLHEAAHGFVATRFGDTTALAAGRVTLNPIKHIDPLGTIIIPLVMLVLSQFHFVFGWAKPVPVNAARMQPARLGMCLTALAGPATNLFLAFLSAAIIKLSLLFGSADSNITWFLLLSAKASILINLLLAFFNLLPLPPLDGGRILQTLLPYRYADYLSRIEPYGFFIVLALVLSGALSRILSPLLNMSLALLQSWIMA